MLVAAVASEALARTVGALRDGLTLSYMGTGFGASVDSNNIPPAFLLAIVGFVAAYVQGTAIELIWRRYTASLAGYIAAVLLSELGLISLVLTGLDRSDLPLTSVGMRPCCGSPQDGLYILAGVIVAGAATHARLARTFRPRSAQARFAAAYLKAALVAVAVPIVALVHVDWQTGSVWAGAPPTTAGGMIGLQLFADGDGVLSVADTYVVGGYSRQSTARFPLTWSRVRGGIVLARSGGYSGCANDVKEDRFASDLAAAPTGRPFAVASLDDPDHMTIDFAAIRLSPARMQRFATALAPGDPPVR
jgi:putative Mn2+ efflux pump MntP